MIYFLCTLFALVVSTGKAKGWGALGLVAIDLGLLFAILRVGGWV